MRNKKLPRGETFLKSGVKIGHACHPFNRILFFCESNYIVPLVDCDSRELLALGMRGLTPNPCFSYPAGVTAAVTGLAISEDRTRSDGHT